MSALGNEFSELAGAPEAEPAASAPETREPEPDLSRLGERAFSAFEGEELEPDDSEERDDEAPLSPQRPEDLLEFQEWAAENPSEYAQWAAQNPDEHATWLAAIEAQQGEAQLEAIANMSPDELQEFLEEFAEEDPVGFAQWSAAMGAEEARAQYAQQLDPVIQKHSEQMAEQTLDALRNEFGEAVLKANEHKLAEAIERDPARFMDPDTRAANLRTVLAAELYDQRQRYERGEDVIEPMGGEIRRDAFGQLPHDPAADEFAGLAYPKPQVSVEDEIAAIDNAHARFHSN